MEYLTKFKAFYRKRTNLKTPKYWNKKGLVSTILLPLGCLYALATSLRIRYIKSKKTSVPVICIGNLTAGGTGKTPVAISIASILQQHNYTPFFVSRGYGGRLKGLEVDNTKHSPEDVGDEPLLLSKQAKVVIDADRYNAASIAVNMGADIIVMDDGFQNPKLHKDLSFIVVDGGFGFGNERPIPSGPLRENLYKGLKRTDAVIIIGEDKFKIAEKFEKIPVFKALAKPVIDNLQNQKIVAFAGIGRPKKFYDSLRSLKADIVDTIDFPDHHKYQEDELKKIINKAKNLDAKIYTTSKDFVKIPANLRTNFNVLDIKIAWKNEKEFEEFLINHI